MQVVPGHAYGECSSHPVRTLPWNPEGLSLLKTTRMNRNVDRA